MLAERSVQITSNMVSTLNAQRQQGNVPLDLKVDVPVKIKHGKLKLMKIKFSLRCNLVTGKAMRNVIERTREHVKSIAPLLSLEPSSKENRDISVRWHLYYMQMHRLHAVPHGTCEIAFKPC